MACDRSTTSGTDVPRALLRSDRIRGAAYASASPRTWMTVKPPLCVGHEFSIARCGELKTRGGVGSGRAVSPDRKSLPGRDRGRRPRASTPAARAALRLSGVVDCRERPSEHARAPRSRPADRVLDAACTARVESAARAAAAARGRGHPERVAGAARRRAPSPGLRGALARRDDRADGGGGLRVHPARLRLRCRRLGRVCVLRYRA